MKKIKHQGKPKMKGKSEMFDKENLWAIIWCKNFSYLKIKFYTRQIRLANKNEVYQNFLI